MASKVSADKNGAAPSVAKRPASAAAAADREKLTLERVIGCTAMTASAVAVPPVTGDLVYPAGSLAVVYHPKRNRQHRFFATPSNAPIAILAFSRDGKYLLAGEAAAGAGSATWVWLK